MDFAVDLTYVDTYRLKGREPNKHTACQRRLGLTSPTIQASTSIPERHHRRNSHRQQGMTQTRCQRNQQRDA